MEPGESLKRYSSITTDRGVTTIPSRLREGAAVQSKTELTWIALEPELWLVGPKARHPETVAPAVAAMLAEHSPFPKLMRRVMAGEIPGGHDSAQRQYRPMNAPELTEEQMIARGAPAETRRHRGRE